jgi:glycoprotein 6-alpha-L-fucosyltransferase
MMASGFNVMTIGRLAVGFVLLWIILVFLGGPLLGKDSNDSSIDQSEMILARLSKASSELRSLKSQNDELKRMIDNLIPLKSKRSSSDNSIVSPGSPSFDYELSLRRMFSNANEFWFFLNKTLKTETEKSFVRDLRRTFIFDLKTIASRDSEWREQQLNLLANEVNRVIQKLQNPKSCENAKKLVCQLNKGCGFGCQIHHVVYCLVVGLAENRTVILSARNWRYMDQEHKKSKTAGWNLIFQPLSKTCLEEGSGSRSSWRSRNDDVQIIDLPIIDSLRPRPDYLPLTIPEQISHRLEQLHSTPIAWFLGQLTRYVMRLSEDMELFINDAKYRTNFRTPVVGLHVRRTDKVGSEASFHHLSEYMMHVEDWYQQLQFDRMRQGIKGDIEKSVYLATDDPGIWTKEVPKFEDKGYSFLGDAEVANSAGIGTRYGIDSLRNVILDIILLSETDYLVCTFSSQVCRVAYELMQTRPHTNRTKDWSQAFSSLDDIYYFGGQSDHDQVAIIPHFGDEKRNEISLEFGDVIGIAGNHWNGFSKGVNRRSQETGLYPSFKTVEKIRSFPFKAFN